MCRKVICCDEFWNGVKDISLIEIELFCSGDLSSEMVTNLFGIAYSLSLRWEMDDVDSNFCLICL